MRVSLVVTSALLGTLQFVMAATSSALVGKLADGTARPMVEVMALCSFLSLAILRLATRRSRLTSGSPS